MSQSDTPSPMELLTVNELCERLKVSRKTVYRWVDSGHLPAPLRIGDAPRWRASDIVDVIDAKAKEAQGGGHA